ncbi:MAG: elongation factor G, partial [Treponema sp.]|nr:elongation factor G [Treponema sp.]
KTLAEQDKLKDILAILSREDPTFTARENAETGQLIISGMGELHLDVLVSRMLSEFNLGAKVGKPQVTYRESITAPAEHFGEFSRVLAGKENSAGVTLRVEPAERGAGNSYKSALSRRDVPDAIFAAVERGVTGAFASGIVMGYPCIDVAVTLCDLRYAELTGTEFAFEACASMAFDEACRKAAPALLEPIMAVSLFTPREFVGEVISLVTQRGGQVLSMDSRDDADEIKARAPMAQMFGFTTPLRGVSQGRASFAMEFSHFEKQTTRHG